MKPFYNGSKIGQRIMGIIKHYNSCKYWRRREIVVNPNNKINLLKKLYYLYYIKKCDAYNNASFGTNLNSGACYDTPPNLPHGPNGIIIGHDVHIGKNVTIYQQVTIINGGDFDR